jgi:hypothetical protein
MVVWTKQEQAWRGTAGPFLVKVSPKGDGRWNWAVFVDGASNPAATGVAASAGAAKTTGEQYVKRSGRV